MYLSEGHADCLLQDRKGEYKMTHGIVDRKNFQHYTYMSVVFQAMDHGQLQYNWLITDCICYPKNREIAKLFDREYCWLSGEELAAVI